MSWPQHDRDHLFFPAIALVISAVAFAGFSFTYFRPIVSGTYPPAKVVLHLHGWSFFFWYLLFPAQAILVAAGRVTVHQKLGRASLVLVALMVSTGVLVLSVRVEEATRTGGPQVWLLYGPLILSNLVLFLFFYAAGVFMAIRNHLEAHKRLVLIASAIALGAGFFRLIFFLTGFHPLSLPIGVLSCSIFIIAGIVYDFITRRAVHPVFWIGLVAMLLVEVSLLPQLNGETVAWVNKGLASLGEQLGFLYRPEPTIDF